MSSTILAESDRLNKQRFHALDALRAYAMLAGIALHLAIYFLPFHFTGSKREYTGHDLFTYFVYMTHMYRMQVFFLMAGFFARLVFRRKGYLGFAWHRFTRIAIPFVIGWVIMYPWCTLCHVWAAVDSGDILTDQPFSSLVWSSIVNDELGGFTLVHLWFLYYLLLSYAIVVVGEWLLKHVLDRRGRLAEVTNRFFRWVIESPLNVLWLSLPLWPLLYWMGDWFGIITPADSLRPHYAATITYTFFFLIGWLLHSQAGLLREFDKRWALNLVAGIGISVALFAYFENGRRQGAISMAYPLLFETDIGDYAAIRSAVREAGDPEFVASTAFLRNALPELHRHLIEDSPELSDGQMASWTMEVNKNVLLKPAAFQPKTDEDRQILERLKAEAARRGHAPIPIDAHIAGTPLHHRWLVEAAFPEGTFRTNFNDKPNYRALIAAFSGAYAVGTWLIIFGSIGFFLRFFSNPSPLVRYFADSSYWLYLIHFPLLWQLNVLLADVPWHWLPKSLLYTFIAFAIMMPSYHYLVRSTWLGKLLNGRTYPFRPWFRRRSENLVMDGEVSRQSVAEGGS